MRLFHFSDDPGIEAFVPRPVRVAAPRAEGREWLNGPLVWAIEATRQAMYLFPRDCPRILVWPTAETSEADRRRWLGEAPMAAYLEIARFDEFAAARLHRYELPPDSFEDLEDAGMFVSRSAVRPLAMETLTDLPDALAGQGADLRVVASLAPLRVLFSSSLHASGIRLRNAAGWQP